MPQEHSIFVSFLPCAISQKNFLDSNPTFMQICQLQLEFLRNGSMVGLVHVVLAITLVSFTKTLSGDTHLNLVKAQFGFNQLISNFKFNSLRLSTNQNQETLLDSLCINRLESMCIFIHLHTRSLKPHPSSNQYPLDNANNLYKMFHYRYQKVGALQQQLCKVNWLIFRVEIS